MYYLTRKLANGPSIYITGLGQIAMSYREMLMGRYEICTFVHSSSRVLEIV